MLALAACASSSRQADNRTPPASAQAQATEGENNARATGTATGGQGTADQPAVSNSQTAEPMQPGTQPGTTGGPSAGSSDTYTGHQTSPAQPDAMPPSGSPGASGTLGTGSAGAGAQVGTGAHAGTGASATGADIAGTGSAGTASAGVGGNAGADATGEDAATSQRHQLLFGSTDRYDVSGKLAAVNTDRGEITIQRPSLPPALLKVDPQTRIQVDGRQGSLTELKPGGDVRASFNLSGRRPIAIQVDETSK